MTNVHPLLFELDAWDAAASSERLAAAQSVSDLLGDSFSFDRLTVHRLGNQQHEIGTFRVGDTAFALLSGTSSALLGYDRSRPFQPTSEQALDWERTEKEYAMTLHDYLDRYLSPLRRIPIRPFLNQIVSEQFVYAQDGDNQAEGYKRVLDHCLPDFRLPTSDEWEYACAAGVRSLFRWGNHTPPSNSYDEKTWVLHRQPNAFGVVMNASTYDIEICQGPKLRGGDGGGSVCGGEGNLASWLPLASSFQIPNDELDGWWIDDVLVRRVRSL